MKAYKFRLYVTGRTNQSQLAIENLYDICENRLRGRCEVEIVDILENPGLAETEKVLATPMLVKTFPEPRSKICGNLSDADAVLSEIGFRGADGDRP